MVHTNLHKNLLMLIGLGLLFRLILISYFLFILTKIQFQATNICNICYIILTLTNIANNRLVIHPNALQSLGALTDKRFYYESP